MTFSHSFLESSSPPLPLVPFGMCPSHQVTARAATKQNLGSIFRTSTKKKQTRGALSRSYYYFYLAESLLNFCLLKFESSPPHAKTPAINRPFLHSGRPSSVLLDRAVGSCGCLPASPAVSRQLFFCFFFFLLLFLRALRSWPGRRVGTACRGTDASPPCVGIASVARQWSTAGGSPAIERSPTGVFFFFVFGCATPATCRLALGTGWLARAHVRTLTGVPRAPRLTLGLVVDASAVQPHSLSLFFPFPSPVSCGLVSPGSARNLLHICVLTVRRF